MFCAFLLMVPMIYLSGLDLPDREHAARCSSTSRSRSRCATTRTCCAASSCKGSGLDVLWPEAVDPARHGRVPARARLAALPEEPRLMPLIALALVPLVALVFVALVPLSLVLRYRAGTARQRARGWLATLNVAGFALSSAMLLMIAGLTSVWVPRRVPLHALRPHGWVRARPPGPGTDALGGRAASRCTSPPAARSCSLSRSWSWREWSTGSSGHGRPGAPRRTMPPGSQRQAPPDRWRPAQSCSATTWLTGPAFGFGWAGIGAYRPPTRHGA